MVRELTHCRRAGDPRSHPTEVVCFGAGALFTALGAVQVENRTRS